MQVFANNAYSSLGASLSNSATSLTLATATGIRFPSPTGGSYFLLTLVGLDSNGNENAWEIVKVTGRASDALTIVRAQESTTAVAWAAGTRVELRATAGTFSSYATLAAPTFTGGITVSSGGASITGDTSVTGTLGVSSTLSTTSGSAVRLYRPDNATYTDISMAAGASGGLIFNNANSDGFTFKNTGSTVAQFSSTGLSVTGTLSATDTLSLSGGGSSNQAAIRFLGAWANAATRDFCIDANSIGYGHWLLRVSNAKGGDPYTAGTTILDATAAGLAVAGNLSVGGNMLTIAQDKALPVAPSGSYFFNIEALSGLGTAGLLIIRGYENILNQTVAVYTYNLVTDASNTRYARLTQISRNTLNNSYGDVYPYFSNYSGSYTSTDQSISGTSTSTSDVYFRSAVGYYCTANFSIIRIN